MVLADRSQHLIRFYDRWIELITLGAASRVRDSVLGQIMPGQRVLDVGCGTGTLAVAAALAGAEVVALDRSESMLALARDKAAAAGVAVDWRRGDIGSLPLGESSFDIATATFVLGELSEEMAALAVRRMAEDLCPGGRLMIADEARPDRAVPRLLSAILRSLLAIASFAVLQRVAPARRHPWQRLLLEAGLLVDSERAYESGALVVMVATRPADLPPARRPLVAIEEVLPAGPRGVLLDAAAWVDLPIAIRPGVYRIGSPGADAPILVTGNFLGSVAAVRAAMAGRDALLAVEDTSGWNVWCAGDAGLFSAENAAALIELHGLADPAGTRRVILPRLGGRIRPRLAALTGWEVTVGPIEARDLPAFLVGGPSPAMRSLRRMYGLRERVRVGTLTLLQLTLLLAPLQLLPTSRRAPARWFGLASSFVLPLAHDVLPGRTGVAKAAGLGTAAAVIGLATRRTRPAATLVMLAVAPLVGWVYQSSSPVIYWKRLWR